MNLSKSTYRKLEELVDALAEDFPKLDRRIKCAALQIKDGQVFIRMRRLSLREVERWFWTMITPNESTHCWEWNGNRDENGYGKFKVCGEPILAHRATLIYMTGQDSELWACHRCHNPPCVSPFHLYWGTQLDNAQDRVQAGHYAQMRGPDNPNSKLTQQQIDYLRSGIAPLVYLARHVGISYHHAWKVATRWRQL